MGVINIVVPPVHRRVFTGGMLCLFEYARGLRARGHDVNIIPLLPSPAPTWIDGDYGRVLSAADAPAGERKRAAADTRQALNATLRELSAVIGMRCARFLPRDLQRGFHLRFVRELMREADVTLASSFETALPVALHGSGRCYYFLQHFEPYFAIDMPDAKLAEHEALASYRLGLSMIANSRWLGRKILEQTGIQPALCTSAIDHDTFCGEPKQGTLGTEVRVISYGGGNASWKGLREMAEAMRIVRAALPGRRIRWLVFGGATLPANNAIASFEKLGFLQPPRLADAYRAADVLLSASWYESFPLFPLEAMACGLPVVTSQPGTEEYAVQGESAQIVEPRDPVSIAAGLRRLIEDDAYRGRLARTGWERARRFCWPAAVERMESLLFPRLQSPPAGRPPEPNSPHE